MTMTRRALFFATVAGAVCSGLAQWNRTRRKREAFRAWSEARRRALGPNRVTDDEAMAYVVRAIHESRAIERAMQQAG